MPCSVLVFLLTALMNTIFPSSSETGTEGLPSTQQPRITFSYCAEFLNYENVIKGEGMESLRYIRVGSNITTQPYSSTKPRAKTVPPYVKWEIKPALHCSGLTQQLSCYCARNREHHSLSYEEPVFVHKHFFPSAGYNPGYPGGETSKERFLRNICVTQR